MPQVSSQPSPAVASFDMKAAHFTIPTLCLTEIDTEALDEYLATQVAKLPNFFSRAPVVLDLSKLHTDEPLSEFPMIVGMLRGHGMIPVGVRGASELQKEQAQMLELAIMPSIRHTTDRQPSKATPSAVSVAKALRIDKPVRSGQRIYARGADLVLMAGVSSGAEVLADGNIHAYGPLRGRALAGVQGDKHSRIFCRDLGAELVSIAGRYRVSEDLDNRYLGRSVQIHLLGDALKFEKF